MKKYIGSIVAAAAVIALVIGYVVFIYFAVFGSLNIGLVVKIVIAGTALIVIGIIVTVLIQRIREIQGGKENDLSKY